MITHRSYTQDWIKSVAKDLDPTLVEKMIMAFTLAEELKRSGLDFVFKGGTSLSLVVGELKRFSIDIDLVVSPSQDISPFFQFVLDQSIFTRIEENKRDNDLPITHYKFFFSSIFGEERSILLDALHEESLYSKIINTEITSPILVLDSVPTFLKCPSPECLLGDKLTAFAPHTTGILYKKDKELEIAKQLFDIATLFDFLHNFDLLFDTYEKVVVQELSYRKIFDCSSKDVLQDTLNTAFMIGMHGQTWNADEFAEITSGIARLKSFIYSEKFSFDSAVICASKTAYLAALILRKKASIVRYDRAVDLSAYTIKNPKFNKLNKLKKSSIEGFFYFYQALETLNWI